MDEYYTVRGYADNDGGRRITRVEISLDKGRSWRLAQIVYLEGAYRHVANEDMELFGGKLGYDCSRYVFLLVVLEYGIDVYGII